MKKMQPPRRREKRRGKSILSPSAILGVFLGSLGASAVAFDFIAGNFYHEPRGKSKLPHRQEAKK
jgi:hypothetical protein